MFIISCFLISINIIIIIADQCESLNLDRLSTHVFLPVTFMTSLSAITYTIELFGYKSLQHLLSHLIFALFLELMLVFTFPYLLMALCNLNALFNKLLIIVSCILDNARLPWHEASVETTLNSQKRGTLKMKL